MKTFMCLNTFISSYRCLRLNKDECQILNIILLQLGQLIKNLYSELWRTTLVGLHLWAMGVGRAGNTQSDVVHLGRDQSGTTAMLHVARAAPEHVLQALPVHHISVTVVDEHYATALRCSVLYIGAGVFILEERFDGLHYTYK